MERWGRAQEEIDYIFVAVRIHKISSQLSLEYVASQKINE